jgi:hypothetical protein
MTSYAPSMTMNRDARAPDPGDPLAEYARSYVDPDYLARTDPLTILRLGQAIRVALRAYDEASVHAARQAGATWQEIGDALGMARQNAQRKYSHLPEPRS